MNDLEIIDYIVMALGVAVALWVVFDRGQP